MKKILRPLLLILLISSLSLNKYFIDKNNRNMTVVDVHDGDTFTLGDGQRVRLLGANAPELGRCMAQEAKQKLSALVLEKTVRITEEKRDTYGRRMGLVYIEKTLVNEVMIREGFARPDYTPNSQSERLKTAFHTATTNKSGLYGSCKIRRPTPPSPDCTIKGNIEESSGNKYYHLSSCRHYNQIVMDLDRGEQFFCSEQEASAAGFRLVPDCLR